MFKAMGWYSKYFQPRTSADWKTKAEDKYKKPIFPPDPDVRPCRFGRGQVFACWNSDGYRN